MSDQKPVGDETKPVKKKRKLTLKQQKLVKALPKADSVAQAGEEAGYSDRQTAHRALKTVQEKMPELMDRLGLTDEYLADKCLRPGLEAMETQFFANKGIVLDQKETIAWGPRQQFLDMAWKLKGRYQQVADAGDNVRSATCSVRVVVTDERRSARLAQLLSDRGAAGIVVDVDAAVDQDLG